MAVAVITGIIRINQFRTNAGMGQGKNVFEPLTMNTKSNMALGQVAGNLNFFSTGANIINDPDIIDNPIVDNGLKSNFAPANQEVF
ncbi:hypothetical protein [Neomoorella thermoacetica]|uniref:Spore germination protein GerPA/GerPF n=2 Tax=Neomoorella thermoacetica TaxID=1525 RepID=A0A1J5NPP1_NEOTH|nr:hypothetical protein [Moorella thermoacetica]OIQ08278.1 hypothetical protein MOOR_21320 [Moorella thermoacetica]OIQ60754.1 hypothetical protein MTIN_16900 [Moorella thermoacetica]GAF26156.1 hypothetical protein MTY_1495 [Moorella thermoacetica Y72]